MKKMMSMALAILMILSLMQPLHAADQTGSKNPLDQICETALFSQIDSISGEMENKTAILIGKDQDQKRVCGILQEDGSFELFEEYTALYPLAGGSLLAVAEDSDPSQLDMSNGGCMVPIHAAGVHGIILGADGKVLYEQKLDEPYQKMYRINDDAILVMAAHAEGDAVILEAGELDAQGNWLIPMGTELITPSRVETYLEPVMDQDGYHWSFTENANRFCYKGVNYSAGQSTALQFIDCSSLGSDSATIRKDFDLAFSSSLNAFMLFRTANAESKENAVFDEMNAETFLFKGTPSDAKKGLTVVTQKGKTAFFEDSDEAISILGCEKYNGYSSLFCYLPGEKKIFTITQGDINSGSEPSFMTLDSEMSETMTGIPALSDEYLAIVTENHEDGNTTSALNLVDLYGTVVKKSAINHLATQGRGFLSGDVLVINDPESGELQIIDTNDLSIRYWYESKEDQTFADPQVLFGKYVTFRLEEEKERSLFGFSLSGSKDKKIESSYCLVDPAVVERYAEPFVPEWEIGRPTGYTKYSDVLNAIQFNSANRVDSGMGMGILYDLDGNGVKELIIAYSQTIYGKGPCTMADVYTKVDGQVVALLREVEIAEEVGATMGYVYVTEKDGQNFILLTMSNGYSSSKGSRIVDAEDRIYSIQDDQVAMIGHGVYRSEKPSGVEEVDDSMVNAYINQQKVTRTAYNDWIASYSIVKNYLKDFLRFKDLYNLVLDEEAENAGSESSEESKMESAEESSEEESREESSSSGMTYFSDDELVSYSWSRRAAANAKWDGQGEIPNGTEFLGQIHFTRDDGTYINYAVFRQYGIFKGQYNSFIWWGRRGSLSGMMEARDSGLLWQAPGLSSYYSYYGVGSLSEFYNYMLVNELNKGYTAAYCDVEGLPL